MVFISYTKKDRLIAKKIANYMVSNGFKIWIDYRNLLFNNDFYKQIRQAIYSCDMIVFLNSAESNNSGWIHLEKCLAISFDKPQIEFDIENPNKTLNAVFSELRRFAMHFRKTGELGSLFSNY